MNREHDNNNIPGLSRRLMAVAKMVPYGSRIADVGTDHGFVPIYLAREGQIEHAVAMDLRKGPLDRASEHVLKYGLENVITTRLSDGLEKLCIGEVDTVICAGMGGILMQKILEKGDLRQKKIKTLILQPQSEILLFRSFLRQNAYEITKEEFLVEDGKYYSVIKADVLETIHENCPKSYTDAIDRIKAVLTRKDIYEEKAITNSQLIRICDRFGPFIILSQNPDFKSFLVHEKEVCDTILYKIKGVENSHKQRFDEILTKRSDIEIALHLL